MEANGNPAFAGSENGLVTIQRRIGTAVVAAVIGVFILFGVGFAHPDVVHNAAHDARHAFSFPCH